MTTMSVAPVAGDVGGREVLGAVVPGRVAAAATNPAPVSEQTDTVSLPSRPRRPAAGRLVEFAEPDRWLSMVVTRTGRPGAAGGLREELHAEPVETHDASGRSPVTSPTRSLRPLAGAPPGRVQHRRRERSIRRSAKTKSLKSARRP